MIQTLVATLHSELRQRLAELEPLVARRCAFIELQQTISVAIGMRRTGKTYLMFSKIQHLLKTGLPLSQILYIDFEDDRLYPLDKDKFAALLDGFYQLYPNNHQQTCYFFLDEVQVIDDWALIIRRFLNTKNVRLYLTGSSAKLLSKEIATALRGRSIATEVWPYDFSEYLVAQKYQWSAHQDSQQSKDLLRKQALNYFAQGGFPALINTPPLNRAKILQEYVDVVIFRDIIQRHKISQVDHIKYIIQYLIANFATAFSVNKFYNTLKSQGFSIGRSTIYEYLAYIEDSYLSFTVPLYAESVRKTKTNPRKLYTIDTGLANAASLRLNDSLGRQLENCVYLDLRRRGDQIFYYLTQESRYEIDFFTRSLDGSLQLYQVALDATDPNTLAREQRALQQAEQELGIKGTLITLENYPTWVLDNHYLDDQFR